MTLGVALGSFQALNAAVYAHYFGRSHAGEIRGVTFVITILGAATGPLPFGWFSTHSSYFPVLAGGATLCGLAATASFMVHEPHPAIPMDSIRVVVPPNTVSPKSLKPRAEER